MSMETTLIELVRERYSLKSDPLDGEAGYRDEWDGAPRDLAAAALYQTTGLSKHTVAERLNVSTGSTCIHNADRIDIDPEFISAIEDRIGYRLT